MVDVLDKVYFLLTWSLTPDTLNSSFAPVAQVINANIVLLLLCQCEQSRTKEEDLLLIQVTFEHAV